MQNRISLKLVIGCVTIVLTLMFGSCKSGKKQYTPVNQNEYKENLVKANRGLVEMDQDRINAYVKRRGWDMKVTETGMWYQIIESNTGDSARQGKIVHLKYQLSLLDGTICYSSDSTGNLIFKAGHGGVETGLEEAVLMMKTNDRGRFIMPPHLAHGLLGDDNKIPPRSTIVYQIELLKIADY